MGVNEGGGTDSLVTLAEEECEGIDTEDKEDVEEERGEGGENEDMAEYMVDVGTFDG